MIIFVYFVETYKYKLRSGWRNLLMYRNEILFVEKFIASLKVLEVSDIPFGNDEFQGGVEKMHKYFNDHRYDLGELADELSLLFLKRPIEGIYDEITDAMLSLNGRLVSFALANPYYEKASIKLKDNEANSLLKDPCLDIDREHILNFAKAFCKGAKINCKLAQAIVE